MFSDLPGPVMLILAIALIIGAILITRAIYSIPEFLQLQREQRDLLRQLVRSQAATPEAGSGLPLPDLGDDEKNAVLANRLTELNKLYRGGLITESDYIKQREMLSKASK